MPIPPRPSRQRANGLPRMIESWCSGRFSPWPRFCRPWVARHRQERGQSGLDSVHRQGGGKPPRRPPKGAARNSLPWVFKRKDPADQAQSSNGRPCPAKCRRRSCAAVRAQAGRRDRAGPGGRHRAAHGARFPAGSGCGQYPHQGAGTQHAVPAPGKRAAGRAARGVRAGRARRRRAGGSHGNHPNAAAGGLGAAARDDGPAAVPPAGTTPTTSAAAPSGRTPSLPPSPIPSPIPSPPPSRKRVPTTAPARWRCSRPQRLPPRRPPQSRPRPRAISYCRSPRTPRPMTRSRGAASCIRPA